MRNTQNFAKRGGQFIKKAKMGGQFIKKVRWTIAPVESLFCRS
jgi:hypothetical protein